MNSQSNSEGSESLIEALLSGSSGRSLRKLVVGCLVAIVVPLILLTPVERRSFIGLNSPCSFTSYSYAGVTVKKRSNDYPLKKEYERLIGAPPECSSAIIVGAQDLYLLPLVATLYSMSGTPVAIAHDFFAKHAAKENTRMSEAAKKQMLLDVFILGAIDDSGLVQVQYANQLMERIEANGRAIVDVKDLPDISAVTMDQLFQ